MSPASSTPSVPVPRERQMRRTQWAEVALSLLTFIGMIVLFRSPAWMPAFVALVLPLGLGLMLWQYRTMDEFRRTRYLKAWAASGIVGMVVMTGLIVWGFFGSLHLNPSSTDVQLSVWWLYLPWGLSWLTFYAVTAFLYRRDTRG